MEQWQAYEKAVKEHNEFYNLVKPSRGGYESEEDYKRAYNKWEMAWSCDMPNKPNSMFSNND